MSEVRLSMWKVIGHMVLTVKICGLREIWFRLWLGKHLMRLAALVIGSKVEIEMLAAEKAEP